LAQGRNRNTGWLCRVNHAFHREIQLAAKLADCCGPLADEVAALGWSEAGGFLRRAMA